MKSLTRALSLSAITLLAGCSSFASKPSTVTPPPAPAATNKAPLQNIDPKHVQVSISTKIFKVILDSKSAKDVDWNKQPYLIEQPLSVGKDAEPDSQRMARLLKGASGFTEQDLIGILERQGEVSLENNISVHTLNGMVTPLSTSRNIGYLIGMVCHNGEVHANGKREAARHYTFTPKVKPDGKVDFEFSITQATTSSEPSSCDDEQKVPTANTLKSSSTLSGNLLISPEETIVVSIAGGMSKKNTNEVFVTMIKVHLRP